MNSIQLENGLKMMVHQMPNTHSVTVGLYVRAGNQYETSEISGITHLLEHLHFRYLENFSQKELYYKMESIGSTLRASTYKDFMKFTMKVRPHFLSECIEIFKSILCTYNWGEKEFEQEKKVVLNQIFEDNSFEKISHLVDETIFKGSRLSHDIMGSFESVSKIKLSQIIEYKKKVFNSENIVLVVTGCIDNQELDMIKNKLSVIKLPIGEKLIFNDMGSRFYKRSPDITFKNMRWDCVEVNLSFDVDYNNISMNELDILNCILGGGVGSKLQLAAREDLAYTSNIYSQVDFYQQAAVLHIKFSVDKKLLYKCIDSVVYTLNELKKNLSQKDLDVSLPFYTDNLWFYEDDTEEMNMLYAYYTFVLNRDFDLAHASKFNLSLDRLKKLANKLFIFQNASIVILGNCNNITKKHIKELLVALN